MSPSVQITSFRATKVIFMREMAMHIQISTIKVLISDTVLFIYKLKELLGN